MEVSQLDLIMPLREQVLELRMRDIAGELTDPAEVEHYKFLCRRLDVAERNLNSVQTVDTATAASVEEQEIEAMFSMDDWTFEAMNEQGKFDHVPDVALFHRLLIVEDPEDRPARPKKPCLMIPDEPERLKLNIGGF